MNTKSVYSPEQQEKLLKLQAEVEFLLQKLLNLKQQAISPHYIEQPYPQGLTIQQ